MHPENCWIVAAVTVVVVVAVAGIGEVGEREPRASGLLIDSVCSRSNLRPAGSSALRRLEPLD